MITQPTPTPPSGARLITAATNFQQAICPECNHAMDLNTSFVREVDKLHFCSKECGYAHPIKPAQPAATPAAGIRHADGTPTETDPTLMGWTPAPVSPAPSANEAREAEQLLIELIATKQVLEEFKQVRVKEMCALLNMEMSATNTRLRDGIKLIHEWAAGASGFGMPSDPNERLDEIDKLCARLKVIAGITTESPRDQITRESFENEGKEHGEPQS